MSRGDGRSWVATGVVALSLATPHLAAAASHEYALAQRNDGSWLAPGSDHVAFSAELPVADSTVFESEAVRLVVVGFTVPPRVRVSTRQASGAPLDALDALALVPSPCPPAELSGSCWSTPPIRLTPDVLDRVYDPVHQRSLEAELGGEFRIEVAGQVLGAWRVGAPHSLLFAGIGRLSAHLRVRILRTTPGGMPAIGGDTGSALLLARREVLAASKLWAQCGVDLQGQAGLDVQVVDPPPTELLAVGCDRGLPASGGQVSFRAAGRAVRVPTHAAESPRVVAQHIATAVRGLGLSAQLSPNPRISSGASGAIDVLVRGARGASVSLSVDPDPHLPLSRDPSLNVCLGEVDLNDGLSHFVEDDAAAGTVEERALIKAFDDRDPSTIDVFIVPSFDQSGRIGESFIDDAGASIQNTVIVDRAALRAGPRSNALAHELGHILLGMPGHPDDYGVDQASSLMDSDASDASVFGPRRLELADCERMLRESGPSARIPLLQAWPLAPTSEPPAPPKPASAAR